MRWRRKRSAWGLPARMRSDALAAFRQARAAVPQGALRSRLLDSAVLSGGTGRRLRAIAPQDPFRARRSGSATDVPHPHGVGQWRIPIAGAYKFSEISRRDLPIFYQVFTKGAVYGLPSVLHYERQETFVRRHEVDWHQARRRERSRVEPANQLKHYSEQERRRKNK